MKRTLLAALLATSTLACSSPDLSTSNAPSCPTGIPFATSAHPDGFTIHAPHLPGWKVREVEGGGGFVLHHFETTEGDTPSFAMATVTAITFVPAKTADDAYNTLRKLGPHAAGWQQSRSDDVEICGKPARLTTGVSADFHTDYLDIAHPLGDKFYPIQIATQIPVANVSRYQSDLNTILSGIRISP
ncbi:hypothetical protein [Nocardia sp. NPDC058705]|uniref:hypothetical protein n=1 Tax=Nocardia sp. NPDC058705 TaxID=3346609 RepID=UPI00368EDC45